MEAKTLECPYSNEYIIQVRIEKNEVYKYITARDLVIDMRSVLAEKLAQCLFEKVEPFIEQALKGEIKCQKKIILNQTRNF